VSLLFKLLITWHGNHCPISWSALSANSAAKLARRARVRAWPSSRQRLINPNMVPLKLSPVGRVDQKRFILLDGYRAKCGLQVKRYNSTRGRSKISPVRISPGSGCSKSKIFVRIIQCIDPENFHPNLSIFRLLWTRTNEWMNATYCITFSGDEGNKKREKHYTHSCVNRPTHQHDKQLNYLNKFSLHTSKASQLRFVAERQLISTIGVS